jgi:hypothetical protein
MWPLGSIEAGRFGQRILVAERTILGTMIFDGN